MPNGLRGTAIVTTSPDRGSTLATESSSWSVTQTQPAPTSARSALTPTGMARLMRIVRGSTFRRVRPLRRTTQTKPRPARTSLIPAGTASVPDTRLLVGSIRASVFDPGGPPAGAGHAFAGGVDPRGRARPSGRVLLGAPDGALARVDRRRGYRQEDRGPAPAAVVRAPP